jgi:hypothetical protein
MNSDFLCKCGHREGYHSSPEDTLKYYNNTGRMCIEYRDAICVKGTWYHNKEDICTCWDFVPDNLKTLEQLSK